MLAPYMEALPEVARVKTNRPNQKKTNKTKQAKHNRANKRKQTNQNKQTKNQSKQTNKKQNKANKTKETKENEAKQRIQNNTKQTERLKRTRVDSFHPSILNPSVLPPLQPSIHRRKMPKDPQHRPFLLESSTVLYVMFLGLKQRRAVAVSRKCAVVNAVGMFSVKFLYVLTSRFACALF